MQAAAAATTTFNPYAAAFTVGMGAIQANQQGKIAKYNQANANRNAAVAEQEAAQIGKQAEFDIAQFDKQFRQLEGEVIVNIAKSGVVVGSGSAYRIAMANALEAGLQKDVINYNAKVGAAKKMEEAQFSRIKGQMARQAGRLAQIKTISTVGTSLLRMKSSPKLKPTKLKPSYQDLNFNPYGST